MPPRFPWMLNYDQVCDSDVTLDLSGATMFSPDAQNDYQDCNLDVTLDLSGATMFSPDSQNYDQVCD